MTRYVIKRVLQALVVLWAAYTVSFFILTLLPGDPVSAMAGAGSDSSTVDPALIEKIKHQYGFDKPVLVQYLSLPGAGAARELRHLGRDRSAGVAGRVRGRAGNVRSGRGGPAARGRLRWVPGDRRDLHLPAVAETVPDVAAAAGVSVPTFWIGLMSRRTVSFNLLFPAFGTTRASSAGAPARSSWPFRLRRADRRGADQEPGHDIRRAYARRPAQGAGGQVDLRACAARRRRCLR